MKQHHLLCHVLIWGMVTLIIVPSNSISCPSSLVVDQQQPAIDLSVGGFVIGGASHQMLAQTIIVGINGSLSQVHLPIVCESGRLVIEIQGVAEDGKPNGEVFVKRAYGGKKLPTLSSQQLKAFIFKKEIEFKQGDRFAIVMHNKGGSCGIFQGPLGNPYIPGEIFVNDSTGWIPNSLFDDRDLPFQTWIEVQ